MSKRAVAVALLAVAGVAGGLYFRSFERRPTATTQAEKHKYQCSMHPQIVSDAPGVCPICGMKLERVDEGRRIVGYRHPMRSDVISPTPAVDEMGMAYIPVYEDEAAPAAGGVPGHAPFTLTRERQQMIGVTRGRVERRPLAVAIRASGRVARDPMLYQAIIEYREAVKAKAGIKDSPWFEAHEGADAVVRSAALKLRQQGITPEQLAALGGAAGDPTNLLLPNAHVWVYAQVYEHELGLVRVGQPVVVTVPSMPARRYDARVVAIDPMIDPVTRSARVRALVATPEAELRPETFVQMTIDVPLGDRLSVPEDAVLDTGTRQIVFVVSGEGTFEPRAVQLGLDAQGYYEVLGGVTEGEEVVTSANFLIDSESRFRSALTAARRVPTAP